MATPFAITLATTNTGKRREIQAMACQSGVPLTIVLPSHLEPVAETGTTFAENARLKALAAASSAQTDWILAEDSGFCVHALSGRDGLADFPGVQSNRWMTPAVRTELLGIAASFDEEPLTQAHLSAGILALMAHFPRPAQRQAHYTAAMTLVSRHGEIRFEAQGQMPLCLIAPDEAPRGRGGFGYDPMVRPPGATLTVAELPPEEKNRLSHRAVAFGQVLAFLQRVAVRA